MQSIKIENAALSDDIMTVQQIHSYIEPTFMHKDGTVDEGTIQISGNYIQTTDSYTKAYGRNSFIQAEAVLNDDGVTLKYRKPSAGTMGWVIIGLDSEKKQLKLRGDVSQIEQNKDKLFSASLGSYATTEFSKVIKTEQTSEEYGTITLDVWDSKTFDTYKDYSEEELLDLYKFDDNGFFLMEDAELGVEVLYNFYGQHVEGGSTKAVGRYAHAEGRNTIAGQRYSHAEGDGSKALGPTSHAEGAGTSAIGQRSHSEGNGTQAIGNCSHTEGRQTISNGSNSHAEGEMTFSNGIDSHAEGFKCVADGNYSHAEGQNTKAVKANSHAEGTLTVADSLNSHVEGNSCSALAEGAHVEGKLCTSNGLYSHVEGYRNNISANNYSHVEGSTNVIEYGSNSHVEGYNNLLSGSNSHVEGYNISAYGSGLHAEGSTNILSGSNSHVEGTKISAYGTCIHVGGTRNKVSSAYSSIYGIDISCNGQYNMLYGRNISSDYHNVFIWNNSSTKTATPTKNGQLKLCPANGIQNFFIGDDAIVSAILAEISTNATYKAKLKEILEL